MNYDKYIVSFMPGSSGRFITSVLDRMIRASVSPTVSPIVLCENNSAHIDCPYTGISHPNPHDPKIFEYLEFDAYEKVVSCILNTHVFPDFDLINKRFSDIGIILIQVPVENNFEVSFNSQLKSNNRILTYNDLIPRTKFELAKFTKFFAPLESCPNNCLVLNYTDLFESENGSFLALTKIKEFAGLPIPQHVEETYQKYVNNRTEMLVKYPWIKPDQDKYK